MQETWASLRLWLCSQVQPEVSCALWTRQEAFKVSSREAAYASDNLLAQQARSETWRQDALRRETCYLRKPFGWRGRIVCSSLGLPDLLRQDLQAASAKLGQIINETSALKLMLRLGVSAWVGILLVLLRTPMSQLPMEA